MNKVMPFMFLFLLFFTACAPAPTSTPAPLESTSTFVETVDAFYRRINEAQSEVDVLLAFNLLTTMAMGNPKIVPLADVSKFQDKWWELKVSYKLYDCGEDVVFAEETLYPRSDSSPVTSTPPHFMRFDLVQSEEGILISNITRADAPRESCVLVLEQ